MSNELMHYGIPGMRWGVRRARYNERMYLRKASNAIGEKRKERFRQKAEEWKAQADDRERLYNVVKTADRKQLKKDVRAINKKYGGVEVDVHEDGSISNYRIKGRSVTEDYARAAMQVANNKANQKRLVSALAGSAIYAAGHAAVQYLLTKRLNEMGA